MAVAEEKNGFVEKIGLSKAGLWDLQASQRQHRFDGDGEACDKYSEYKAKCTPVCSFITGSKANRLKVRRRLSKEETDALGAFYQELTQPQGSQIGLRYLTAKLEIGCVMAYTYRTTACKSPTHGMWFPRLFREWQRWPSPKLVRANRYT